MRPRIPLDGGYLDYFEGITACKAEDLNERLGKLQAKVELAYESYEDNYDSNTLEDFVSAKWKSQQHKDLLACYSGKSKGLSKLKRDIQEAQPVEYEEFCPLCGVATAEEFDHYIPKEDFPEVAVHALNLVPCCGRCNRKKSNKWLNEHGQRRVLHFYTDKLPDEKFLFATINWKTRGAQLIPYAEFELIRPKGFGKDAFSLIERHFETMELFDRYRRHTMNCVSELIRSMVQPGQAKTTAVVNRWLKWYAKRNSDRLGKNHWKVAIAEALIGDANFRARL